MKGGSLLYWLIVIVMVVAMWVIFTKAKKPGWAAIIPIYNLYILDEIVKKPWWWIILWFIPVVNLVIYIIVMHNLSQRFGQGIGFTVGLILLPFIFMPLLAFGNYHLGS